jgi:hypothetical protein
MKETIETVVALCASELNNLHPLAAIVLRQLNGGETPDADCVQNTLDAAKHGADGGFNGFTYSAECETFVSSNLDAIRRSIFKDARDYDLNAVAFVQSWPAVKRNDATAEEIMDALYGQLSDECDAKTGIVDALAWYALESVGRALEDYLEGSAE